MEGPLRKSFHESMTEIDTGVVQLYGLVIEGIAAATDTLLSGDRETASAIKASDKVIDTLNNEIGDSVERMLLLQSPVASDLHFLLSVLRIVPELERSGDLAEHIAQRANLSLAADLTPSLRGLIEHMGRLGVEMWRAAADAYSERDGSAAAEIDAMDDELDDLHDRVSVALLDEAVPRKAALEMALVARFYERLGDHAVHITERLANLTPRS